MVEKQLIGFISYSEEIQRVIAGICSVPYMHARWLNTLSYLENCGARKIAACEHPTKVRCEMLKHAAEEFRHAYHLKMQIGKVSKDAFTDYTRENLLGGFCTIHYLSKLEGEICRVLKKQYGMPLRTLKEMAYLLVTYAIEKRASILYPLYQQMLSAIQSIVSMRAIIAEEDKHLAEMEEELEHTAHRETLMATACTIESALFFRWLESLQKS